MQGSYSQDWSELISILSLGYSLADVRMPRLVCLISSIFGQLNSLMHCFSSLSNLQKYDYHNTKPINQSTMKRIVFLVMMATSFVIPVYATAHNDLNPYQEEIDAASQDPAAVLGARQA